jgi:hypothetical protein
MPDWEYIKMRCECGCSGWNHRGYTEVKGGKRIYTGSFNGMCEYCDCEKFNESFDSFVSRFRNKPAQPAEEAPKTEL